MIFLNNDRCLLFEMKFKKRLVLSFLRRSIWRGDISEDRGYCVFVDLVVPEIIRVRVTWLC